MCIKILIVKVKQKKKWFITFSDYSQTFHLCSLLIESQLLLQYLPKKGGAGNFSFLTDYPQILNDHLKLGIIEILLLLFQIRAHSPLASSTYKTLYWHWGDLKMKHRNR